MSNILVIAEGPNDEKILMNAIIRNFIGKEYTIYPYCSNIHVLINEFFKNGETIDTDLDIKNVLIELENKRLANDEKTKNRIEKLKVNFSSVYLIFDFDPQHGNIDCKKIRQFLDFFDNETENGKLYINYPMIQSYKHLNKMPDYNFVKKSITLKDAFSYKKIVNDEGNKEFFYPSKYSFTVFISIVEHHIFKMFKLLDSNFDLESIFTRIIIGKYEKMFFDFSEKELKNEIVYILNTSLFVYLDFKFETFVSEIKKRNELFVY